MWTSEDVASKSVRIDLYRTDKKTKVRSIISSTLNDKSHKWLVPTSVTPGKYKIRVQTTDNRYTSWTDDFRIGTRSIKNGKDKVIHSTWPTAQNTKPKGERSLTVIPTISTRQHRWTRDVVVFNTKLADSGTAFPPLPPPRQMRVGYEHHYDTSGILKSDKEYLAFASRGLVKIKSKSLSRIKGEIISATLTMNITNAANNRCASKLYRLTTPFIDFKSTGGNLYSLLPKSGKSRSGKVSVTASKVTIDITSLVKNWKSGRYPNHGLMFVGPSEGIAKNNTKCYTIFSSISIRIVWK
jgi:hypothetical protein